jgi:GxxExxY protein
MNENELSYKIIGLAIKVHRELGPGLLESSYKECLFYELTKSGHMAVKEKALPLVYHDIKLDVGYRVDLLVENTVIVEVKSVDALNPVHESQLLTYLKLSGCRIGLLINFNVNVLKEGIKRMVNGY